jgi:mono/diheme cytochrome c family protein
MPPLATAPPSFRRSAAGRRWPGLSRAAALALSLSFLVTAPALAQDGDGDLGQQVYAKWCSHCHGEDGSGQGVAALRLRPEPRDFTSGKYKVRTTTTGNIPTDADIERAIRRGLAYTSMPAFPPSQISDAELDAVVGYIKSFSDWFSDPELQDPEVVEIPEPPPYDAESAATVGRQIYEETGCARCHGNLGRGDGSSAPTLVDDWGNHIRVADLTMPWTFRGGGTRKDIFRTMSTGFNGTPMPGFHNALGSTPEESRERMWAIVDYIISLAGGPPEGESYEAPYANLLRSVPADGGIDLEQGAELFENAPKATFPLFGQIVEPGRNFYPQIYAVTAQAIHNDDEVAIRLTWHDMRAETVGSNAPDLEVPEWDGQLAEVGVTVDDGGGDEEGGGFWGDAAADEGADEGGGDDFWGDAAADESEDGGGGGDDFWGDAAADEGDGGGGDDFWGEEESGGDAGSTLPEGPTTEFSDAVAIQLPLQMPTGIRQPYFLFGDAQNPVDLWFVDLADPDRAVRYEGRGSSAVTPAEGGEPVETVAEYRDGEWSVILKRQRQGGAGVTFEEGSFLPIAFTVWNGFNRERGNKRALTSWYHLYVEPLEKPSPVKPMVQAGVAVLLLELLFIGLIRRRHGKSAKNANNAEKTA